MSGFFEVVWAIVVGIGTPLLMMAAALLMFVVMGVVWIDTLVIDFWVVLDKVLGALPFLPAPLSWALICGGLAFLTHLGCTSRRD